MTNHEVLSSVRGNGVEEDPQSFRKGFSTEHTAPPGAGFRG